MKTTIEKLVRTTVEVEIPEKCPACDMDFTDGSELHELAWNDVVIAGRINPVDKVFEPGGGSDSFDSYIVTGYRCECGHVLASTEEEEVSS